MARKCIQCGADIRDGVAFCTDCGAKAPEAVQGPATAAVCGCCGAPMRDGIAFCTECGAKQGNTAPVSPPPTPAAPPPPPPQTPPVCQVPPQQPAPPQSPELSVKGTKYEPITTGGFLGIMLLLCIPVVGFILLIVWACGGCRKISKRSFARASLILTAITLVLSLIAGLVLKTAFDSALSSLGLSTSQLSGLLGGLADGQDDINENTGILGILGGLSGTGNSGTEDIGSILGALSGIGAGEGAGLEDILGALGGTGNIGGEDITADGWPEKLRPYPGGTSTSVESYRTESTGTTLEEMKEYIEDLKKDGYKYQDFYGLGFSEEDMLAANGWWGTNGEIFLSLAFAEGTVTVDHTYELPDLNFG